MSSAASRQFRSARNGLAEALGLGEPCPLRDLPVTTEPPVVPFGNTADVAIADSERTVTYSLLDQTGKPLPGNGGPQGAGTGATLDIASPPVDEDVTYMIGAARPSGRTAILFAAAAIKVGLDKTLPARIASVAETPAVIDYRATVDVAIDHSQEGVTYNLVARPDPDTAAPDDMAAIATDTRLSAPAGTGGTGGTITITSTPLSDDTVIRIRAVKTFGGSNARPPQTMLLTVRLPVFVRPDAGLAVTAGPVIVDHGGASAVTIAKAAAGIAYRLHARRVPDADFRRATPPDPATLAIPTPGGEVRVAVPAATPAWKEPDGFDPLGDAATGTGADLTLPTGPLAHDTLLIVEARKTHGAGADRFTSAERLNQPAGVLVRPDPKPPLRLEAILADGKLTELHGLAGEPGVFYAVGAAATGELYFHQIDPGDASRNKGIGALAVAVDLVPGSGPASLDTGRAPPPLPRLAAPGTALPAALAITARRAMTNLTADLGAASVAVMPAVQLPAAPIAAGSSAKVTIAAPVAGERYRLLINGTPVADPVTATAALSLDTGPLPAGAVVELWAMAGDPGAAVTVERRAPLAITVA